LVTSRRHLTRHDMKKDEFVSWLTRATVWVEENTRTVLYALVGVVVVAVAVAGIFSWQRSRAVQAFTMLAEVQKAARSPIRGEPGAAPDAPASSQERAALVVDAADRMLREFGGGDAVDWARYHRAAALLEIGRKDEAASETERILGRADKGSLLAGLTRLLSGRVEEARGNMQKAADAYAAAAADAGTSFPPEVALFDQARCLQVLGNRQEAINTLQKIVDVYPDSPLVARANQKLQELRTASLGS